MQAETSGATLQDIRLQIENDYDPGSGVGTPTPLPTA